MAATAHLTAVAPDNEKFTVVPRRNRTANTGLGSISPSARSKG